MTTRHVERPSARMSPRRACDEPPPPAALVAPPDRQYLRTVFFEDDEDQLKPHQQSFQNHRPASRTVASDNGDTTATVNEYSNWSFGQNSADTVNLWPQQQRQQQYIQQPNNPYSHENVLEQQNRPYSKPQSYSSSDDAGWSYKTPDLDQLNNNFYATTTEGQHQQQLQQPQEQRPPSIIQLSYDQQLSSSQKSQQNKQQIYESKHDNTLQQRITQSYNVQHQIQQSEQQNPHHRQHQEQQRFVQQQNQEQQIQQHQQQQQREQKINQQHSQQLQTQRQHDQQQQQQQQQPSSRSVLPAVSLRAVSADAAAAVQQPVSDSVLLALRRSQPNTRLFRALFQYIPLRDSPNDNPQLELALQAGDFVLVHGHMDEDRFYFGETLTGRAGLVPSNYVERVPDYLLLQNAARQPDARVSGGAAVSVKNSTSSVTGLSVPATSSAGPAGPTTVPSGSTLADSPSFVINVPMHHAQILHDFTDQSAGQSGTTDGTPMPHSVCPYPPVDVSRVVVQEVKQPDQPRVTFPRELCVEKRLSRSVLISWLPPDDFLPATGGAGSASTSTADLQYHVCVDGRVRSVVPGLYKCKALIEDLDLDRFVNVSVRAIHENGTHSADAACTIAVGDDAPVAPQHVRVSQITPVSARVSWYPSNSAVEHVLLLNAAKVGVCPGGAGVYQVQLNGLQPSTIYRVSVRTKQPRAVLEKRPVERCVDFKTLSKIGLPDPPENVQVEAGPQPGTLLISWTPVRSQPRPPSRAAVHSYLVYADGRNVAQIPSPNADHFVLRLADLADDPPIFITVRTRTREDVVSADSNVVRVPRALSGDHAGAFLLGASSASALASTSRFTAVGGSSSLTNSLIGALPSSDLQQQQQLQQMHSLPLELIQQQQLQQQPLQQQQTPRAGGLLTTTTTNNMAASYCNSTLPAGYCNLEAPGQSSQGLPAGYCSHLPAGYSNPAQQQLSSAMNMLNLSGYGMTPAQQAAAILACQQQQQFYQQQQSSFTPSQAPSRVGAAIPAGGYGISGGAAALPNYSHASNQMLNDWKQSQAGQYYLFHPKSLYKEYSVGDEIKPSVLELENNYFIKHHQQQTANRVMAAAAAAASSSYGSRGGPAGRYYSGSMSARNLPPTCGWPSAIGGGGANIFPGEPLPRRTSVGVGGAQPPLPLRLSRVRSEEQLLDTRSEPDLRPAAPIPEPAGYGGGDPSMAPHYFVALYDYDHSMSPNPNAKQEELSFRKHQLIKVYGDVDRDGFYYGEVGRRFGLVPSNMVIEIAKDDLQLPERRRSEICPPMDPVIRRMRWGSLKSRSYDNPGERTDRHTVPRYYAQRNAAVAAASAGWDGSFEPYQLQAQRNYQNSPAYSSSLERKERERSMPPPANRYYHDSGAGGSSKYGPSERGSAAPLPSQQRRDAYSATKEPRGGSFERTDSYDHAQKRAAGGLQPSAGYYGRSAAKNAPPDYDQYSVSEAPAASQRPRDLVNGNGSDAEYGGASTSRFDYEEGGTAPRGAARPRVPAAGDSLDERYGADGGSYGNGSGSRFALQAPQYRQDSQTNLMRHNALNSSDPMANVVTRRIPAKYNYNSQELSPNPDAEVELSFSRGDVITVFGEVDEDGFFMGELNGIRGLVPSNFLDLASAQPPMAAASNTQPTQRSKGVAFSASEGPARRTGGGSGPPIRQSSQTSGLSATAAGGARFGALTAPALGSGVPPGFALTSAASGGKSAKIMGGSGPAASSKTPTKKSSDLNSRSVTANNTVAASKKAILSSKKDSSGKKKG